VTRNFLLWAAVALAAASPLRAEIDGHGPDVYRVTGVAANDVLNMRMGPGAHYLVIDRLPPDARGVQQVICLCKSLRSITS
jgi:uncharacterized protein YgiM (DUF1202 family)